MNVADEITEMMIKIQKLDTNYSKLLAIAVEALTHDDTPKELKDRIKAFIGEI